MFLAPYTLYSNFSGFLPDIETVKQNELHGAFGDLIGEWVFLAKLILESISILRTAGSPSFLLGVGFFHFWTSKLAPLLR